MTETDQMDLQHLGLVFFEQMPKLFDQAKQSQLQIPVQGLIRTIFCRFLRKVNLNSIIERVINLHDLSETNADFSFSKKKSQNFLSYDQEQLNRVFINLIKNAIESISEKATKNKDFRGKINIDIKDDSDYIYVTIEDNGVGFDRVDKEKMLTPYFTTKKNGTGLGLAIVTKIINDHDSSILFNSVKNGAKIEITFPKYYV